MAKILIADDSENLLKVLRKLLKTNGHEVLEASTGNDAVEIARRTPDLDIVITDMYMPNGDGLDVCEQIHWMPAHKELPIIMLTVDGNPDVRSSARKAGILLHISKPIVPEKIIAAVNNVLAMKG